DFLDKSCISKIIGSNPINRKTTKRDTSLFNEFNKTNDGRMIINESDEESQGSDIEMNESDNYYLEAQRSSVGFTRGQGSKVKFNKGQRDNDNDMELDDIEPIDIVAKRNKKNRYKRNTITVGKEYKAKNAEGDVKRKGKPDPYAYVPLTSMYRKKGQKGIKISLTNRKAKKKQIRKVKP
ncbi:19362_t:CDS:1, partial [Racocetra persica]